MNEIHIKNENKVLESNKHTFYRIILWRFIAFILSILVVFFFTGNILNSINIAIVSNITKILAHYTYERMWLYFIS